MPLRVWVSTSTSAGLTPRRSGDKPVHGLPEVNQALRMSSDTSGRVNRNATATVEQARASAEAANIQDPIVTQVGSNIRIQTQALTPTQSAAVTQQLSTDLGVAQGDIAVTLVGPSWGAEITQRAVQGLVVFLVLVVVFLSAYFEWRLAIAALVALIHDLVITIGIYALTGFEVTPATVICVLTILGFSLYDTVVVFDKVKENTRAITSGNRATYSEAANLALNQTLVRSINTSIVALLPVTAILVVGVGLLGAGTLKDLALALFIGTAAGTYSSIFIATPVACQLEERRPEMKALAARVAQRRAGGDARSARSRKATGGAATGTAVLDDVESDTDLDAGGVTPEDLGGTVAPSGPRSQPKKNQARSKRKK